MRSVKYGYYTANRLYDRLERLGESFRGWWWRPRSWGYQVLRRSLWSSHRRHPELFTPNRQPVVRFTNVGQLVVFTNEVPPVDTSR